MFLFFTSMKLKAFCVKQNDIPKMVKKFHLYQQVVTNFCRKCQVQHEFRWAVGEHKIVFYADDSRMTGCNPIWVQKTLTEVVQMFERVGLQSNLRKTKVMVCTLGFI